MKNLNLIVKIMIRKIIIVTAVAITMIIIMNRNIIIITVIIMTMIKIVVLTIIAKTRFDSNND